MKTTIKLTVPLIIIILAILLFPARAGENCKPLKSFMGYPLNEKIASEITNQLAEKSGQERKDAEALLKRRFSESLSIDDPNREQKTEAITYMLLLGLNKIEGGEKLLIEHLDFQVIDHQGVVKRPATDALAAYGEQAVPFIIDAFQKGLKGDRAAQAAKALADIKQARYKTKDYMKFLLEIKPNMSEAAFRELNSHQIY